MNGIVSYVIYVVFMGLYLLSFFKFKKMNKVFVGFYMLLILYVLSYAYLSFAHNDYWFLAAAFVVLASTCGAIYSQLFKEKIDLPSRSIQKINLFFWVLSALSVSLLAISGIRDGINQMSVSFFIYYAASVFCTPFMGKYRIPVVVLQILLLLKFCYIYFPSLEGVEELEAVHYIMGTTTLLLLLTLFSFVLTVYLNHKSKMIYSTPET